MPTAPTSATPAVELRSVVKSFAGVRAVDKVDLQASLGETLALLGPSGCGKTTTLRLINRLETPESGQVLVRGRPVLDQPAQILRRSMGYVIQEGGLFPHLSVGENVATVPRLLRWDSRRIRKRCDEVLDQLGMTPSQFAHRRPEELSGGQRQRVGVARALAGDPDILLMDEPFSALDPMTRDELHQHFRTLQARLQKTVLLVTHDMIEAGRLADRVALMNRGQIVQIGRMSDLLFRPQDPFVEDFFAGHRQRMILETVLLEDLLDHVPQQPGQAELQFPSGTKLQRCWTRIVQGASRDLLEVSDGRHRDKTFRLADIQRLILSDAPRPSEAEKV